MPLHVYPNIYASGSVPSNFVPSRGGARRYRVKNKQLLIYLRSLVPGQWQKVIKQGNIGEVHYFEHNSGQVADVKFFP